MSVAARDHGRHTYGHSTIDGSARVQLGDINSYTYHYSFADTKDAIYKNTLAVTLSQIIHHQSLCGSFARIPASRSIARKLKESLSLKLDTLQTYLARVQKIEQKHVLSVAPESRNRMLESTMADSKVEVYINMTSSLLPKLSDLAKWQCSNKGQVSCLDDFCDLVERLIQQLAARRALGTTVAEIPGDSRGQAADEDVPTSLEGQTNSDTHPADLPEQHRNNTSYNEQEYLYATRDFWRQLTSILQEMVSLPTRCWKRLLFKFVIPLAIFTVVPISLVNASMKKASIETRIALSVLAIFMILWGDLCDE
ncbi:hypothetical protein LTR64_003858 [Lithohypha guttulata]|uniref:uncharacterized protein n=1 Tax=Lithohypha guttulata TaxID=1690604 RepID=UPI002DDEE05F|nr:hypothetical protein LTR51_006896 [Lithohypha guttulata]